MSASDGLVIVGSFALGIFVVFFWLLGIFHITLAEDDFIKKIIPYDLLLGLITLGSGIGIKIYRWKNSSG